MKILVTGSEGFVGKNLVVQLNRMENLEVLEAGRSTTDEQLAQMAGSADAIFHLAGVNRPKEEVEFTIGNADYTNKLLNFVAEGGKCPLFVISSSTQAELTNPYGLSKRHAELAVENAAINGAIKAVVYRLPGVFGKWSKPNYNSVVSTFCHNVANGLDIEVRDSNYSFPLVYVDDVVESFVEQLSLTHTQAFRMEQVRLQFNVSLGYLADTIKSFPESRKTLVAPKVGDPFIKRLYSTYLSYLPSNAFSYPMELKVDNRGDLFEWIKSEDFGQIFISTTKPGITRGNHFHHTKTEKFLVIRGEAVIKFRKIDAEEVIEYPVSGNVPTVVDIPTGYTHSITNIGDSELITLFWANEIFDQSRPDTFFLEV